MPLPSSKRGLKGFYRDVMRELRHVTWPTQRESVRLTGIVLAVCFFVTALLTILSVIVDFAFRLLFRGGA